MQTLFSWHKIIAIYSKRQKPESNGSPSFFLLEHTPQGKESVVTNELKK